MQSVYRNKSEVAQGSIHPTIFIAGTCALRDYICLGCRAQRKNFGTLML